jgi:hypothetical protein
MLKYHGRNKPVADDNLYFKVAEVTAGWSAAALANLMNEAAILTVRPARKTSLPWRPACTASPCPTDVDELGVWVARDQLNAAPLVCTKHTSIAAAFRLALT